MKTKKPLSVEYRFVDYELLARQKRLDDAFDLIFDEIELKDSDRINNQNEYEHPITIER